MAAQDPNTGGNSTKFWINGLPRNVLQKSSSKNDIGTQKYWIDGLPQGGITPAQGYQKVQVIFFD